jgi:dTDP-4-amino-4,6-dideoxygalactose transaminase
MIGCNSRLDTLQAAVLLAKLPQLSAWNAKRRANADNYRSLLSGIEDIVIPTERPQTAHTFHIYAVRAEQRDALKAFLSDRGIQSVVHYPYALHTLPAYRYLDHGPDDFPVADRLSRELLSLPVYPEITAEQLRYVCEAVRDFYSGRNGKNQ